MNVSGPNIRVNDVILVPTWFHSAYKQNKVPGADSDANADKCRLSLTVRSQLLASFTQHSGEWNSNL